MGGAAYRGHFILPLPEQEKGKWSVLVMIEVHAKGQVERIHYRDPLHAYATREEAESAAIDFGKQMIENFIAPNYGEGEYQGSGA